MRSEQGEGPVPWRLARGIPPSSCRDRHRPFASCALVTGAGSRSGLSVCESAISPFQAAVDSRENRCDASISNGRHIGKRSSLRCDDPTPSRIARKHAQATGTARFDLRTHASAFANRKNTARRCGDDMLVRRSGYDLKVFRQWSKIAKSLATNEASKRV